MKVSIKKLHEKAVIPAYAKEGDAGLDFTAVDISRDSVGNITYHTGLAMAIPDGYVGLLFPRSSISKKQQFLTNCVGVIDSNLRKLKNLLKLKEDMVVLEVLISSK